MPKVGSEHWGSFDRKHIYDYPVMHRMLADLFNETHLFAVAGASPKLGFRGGRLVAPPYHRQSFDLEFWGHLIGKYRIMTSFVSEFVITIDVTTEYPNDILLPDTFVLLTAEGTFSITVSDHGALESIEMIFDSGMPEFGCDLIRDFPGRNAKSDKVLKHILAKKSTLPDKALLSGIHFAEVTTVEV